MYVCRIRTRRDLGRTERGAKTRRAEKRTYVQQPPPLPWGRSFVPSLSLFLSRVANAHRRRRPGQLCKRAYRQRHRVRRVTVKLNSSRAPHSPADATRRNPPRRARCASLRFAPSAAAPGNSAALGRTRDFLRRRDGRRGRERGRKGGRGREEKESAARARGAGA